MPTQATPSTVTPMFKVAWPSPAPTRNHSMENTVTRTMPTKIADSPRW